MSNNYQRFLDYVFYLISFDLSYDNNFVKNKVF